MNTVAAEHMRGDGRLLSVVHGDITEEAVDAIVNAANEHLAHGGGVAGAIVRKGGRQIQEESDRWVREHGVVRTGTAAVTGAGRLRARHVIHAVGPVWGVGNEEALLADAVTSALSLATDGGMRTISLPAISTGIFGFPKPLGAQVIVKAVQQYLDGHPDSSLREVRFCNIDRQTTDLFVAELGRVRATA